MMTAAALIELLEDLDPETEIRIAHQPSWPFEYSISAYDHAFEEEVEGRRGTGPVFWLAEAQQLGYLSRDVAEQLGWR